MPLPATSSRPTGLSSIRAVDSPFWNRLVAAEVLVPAAQILVTVLVAVAVRWIIHRAIDKVVRTSIERADAREATAPRRTTRALAQAAGLVGERHRQRAATTGSLLRSVTSIAVLALVVLVVLGEVGVSLAPLIASAGVVGIALGFGAQSLVKDFLSGIFMIVEDQYGVGDVVDTGFVVGTVEDVSLRITRMRDGSGVVWYVRNGEILRLGNHTQGWSTATVDVPVAYGTDLDGALAVLSRVAVELDQDEVWAERLVKEPEVTGVELLSGGALTLRVVLACAPGDADPVARELRARLVPALDRAGIQLGPGHAGMMDV